MIKYNLNTINDWNFGDDNIIKVYRNNAVCYYKITGGGDTPTAQTPCFAVVQDITQYSDTEFEDVFNLADEKWYKLNNLNQYEEYGIYGSGRTITTYDGKLTVDDGYEYMYSGGSWVNVGEVSGSSKTSSFTIDDINNDVTVKSSISDGDYYVISYYNHNNPKEPRYMMSYTESNNYLNNFSGHTGSNTITPSTIIDAAIWKFEATSSANTYYIKNIHNNLYWGYQRRVSTRSLNLVGESDSSKAIVKVGVANSATTVGFVELNVNGSRYTYEDGTVGGYALNQLNGYTYRMNWWNTAGWGSDGNSAYYLYKIEGGTIVYPVEYDEMQDPPNNLTFSSMTEAEAYECPWVGMKATIDGDKYVFSGDSQSGYEWVENQHSLPDVPFVLNYNAKDYDASTHVITKTSGQLNDVDAVITGTTSNISDYSSDGYIRLTGSSSTPLRARVSNSSVNGYFNRNNTNPNLTVIAKILTQNSNTADDVLVNRDSNYNWMYRHKPSLVTLHGSSEQGSIAVSNTVPNICSARVASNRLLTYNNWTQNTTSTYSNFNYGSTTSDGGALFCSFATDNSYFWKGDFYWIYMSQNTLTDEQVQQVIDYNENL